MRVLQGGDDHSFAVHFAIKHLAPRVDNHAVPMRMPAARVVPTLRGSENITLIFNGSGAQKRAPVRSTGYMGEGRRDEDQIQRVLGAHVSI